MLTYQEYQQEIAKLQSLAEKARNVEIVEARRCIKELMQQHGLTLDDLLSQKKTKPPKKSGVIKQKYRDPATGQTWSGRGRSPRWLDGKNREDFLIS